MTYFITNSGTKIDIEDISINDINLKDIAHHLTKICRYGGALDLNKHYSVANHSMVLFHYAVDSGCSEELQKSLLLHDAAECYLGDIVAGLKKYLPDYRYIEHKLESLIKEKYQISNNQFIIDLTKELDTRIVLDEARAFMPQYYNDFQSQVPHLKPLGVRIYSETMSQLNYTKQMFIHCCNRLSIKD